MKIPVEWPEDDLLAEDLTTDKFVKTLYLAASLPLRKELIQLKRKQRPLLKKKKHIYKMKNHRRADLRQKKILSKKLLSQKELLLLKNKAPKNP
jgi:shikimate kinase